MTGNDKILRAVWDRRYGYVHGWLESEFAITVTVDQVMTWCEQLRPISGHCGDFRMWFKKRLEEAGCFPCGSTSDQFGKLTTKLHVAFVAIVETPEHIANLMDWSADDVREMERKLELLGMKNPMIEHYMGFLRAIDRTAARVAPVEPVPEA